MMLMTYTTFLERTAFPLDLDCLEMARTLVPKLDQGGIVLTVLDWVGGGLHGEPGGSKQVPAGGEHHLPKGECTDIQYESVLYILYTTAFHMEMEDNC